MKKLVLLSLLLALNTYAQSEVANPDTNNNLATSGAQSRTERFYQILTNRIGGKLGHYGFNVYGDSVVIDYPFINGRPVCMKNRGMYPPNEAIFFCTSLGFESGSYAEIDHVTTRKMLKMGEMYDVQGNFPNAKLVGIEPAYDYPWGGNCHIPKSLTCVGGVQKALEEPIKTRAGAKNILGSEFEVTRVNAIDENTVSFEEISFDGKLICKGINYTEGTGAADSICKSLKFDFATSSHAIPIHARDNKYQPGPCYFFGRSRELGKSFDTIKSITCKKFR